MSLQGLLRGASGSSSLIAPLGQWFRRVSNILDTIGPVAKGAATTVGAVTADVAGTVITVPLNASARVTVSVVGEVADGSAVFSRIFSGVFRHPAGGLVQEGATQAVAAAIQNGVLAAGTIAADFTPPAGSSVQVRVTGQAGQTVLWKVQAVAVEVFVP